MKRKVHNRLNWYYHVVSGAQWWAVILILALSATGPAAWAAGVDTRALEDELMCYCECNMVLSTCECEEAVDMRQQIAFMVGEGFDKQQILAAFVKKYGETILTKPSGGGVNTLAWVMPFVALGAGCLLVVFFLRRKVPAGEDPDPPIKASPPSSHTMYDHEVDEEIKKYL